MPAGPRLYETAYVLLVCIYPPCPPGAFLFAIRAKGMLPVEGSYGSPEVPGPQYLHSDQRQHGDLPDTTHRGKRISKRQVSSDTATARDIRHSAKAAPAHARHHFKEESLFLLLRARCVGVESTYWLLPPDPFFQPSGRRFRVHDPDDGVYPSSVTSSSWNMTKRC
jgi:hypothetical protein